MPWIAPEITRVDAPLIGDDRALLTGQLERNRSCLMYKCGGLTGEQLAERSVPPSTMSLLGLVRHMTEVERHWFRRGFRGERLEHAYWREDRPDAAFDEVDPARAEEDFVRLNQEWEQSRQAVTAASLDDTSPTSPGWSLITDHCPWAAENCARELGETLQVIHCKWPHVWPWPGLVSYALSVAFPDELASGLAVVAYDPGWPQEFCASLPDSRQHSDLLLKASTTSVRQRYRVSPPRTASTFRSGSLVSTGTRSVSGFGPSRGTESTSLPARDGRNWSSRRQSVNEPATCTSERGPARPPDATCCFETSSELTTRLGTPGVSQPPRS